MGILIFVDDNTIGLELSIFMLGWIWSWFFSVLFRLPLAIPCLIFSTLLVCKGDLSWAKSHNFFIMENWWIWKKLHLKIKNLLAMASNILPLHLKQTFPSIIWIFNQGEGDGIEFRLPFKIFSTLHISINW